MPPLSPSAESAERSPNCWQCRHFAITHMPLAPYACRMMGFQSRRLPALEVLSVDGHVCRSFQPKVAPTA